MRKKVLFLITKIKSPAQKPLIRIFKFKINIQSQYFHWSLKWYHLVKGFNKSILQSNQVKRTPQEYINEFIIQKLNPLLVVDFRSISAFLHV